METTCVFPTMYSSFGFPKPITLWSLMKLACGLSQPIQYKTTQNLVYLNAYMLLSECMCGFTMHISFSFGQVESYVEVTFQYFKWLTQYHSTIIKASNLIQMYWSTIELEIKLHKQIHIHNDIRRMLGVRWSPSPLALLFVSLFLLVSYNGFYETNGFNQTLLIRITLNFTTQWLWAA